MYDGYRQDIQDRILEILSLINHPIKPQLEKNIALFSNKELFQILQYLETGSLNTIDQFLEDKKKEYLELIAELQTRKRYAKLAEIKKAEMEERYADLEEIEKIEFDF